MEAAFLGLHHHNTVAALACPQRTPSSKLLSPVSATSRTFVRPSPVRGLGDGWINGWLGHPGSMNPSPCRLPPPHLPQQIPARGLAYSLGPPHQHYSPAPPQGMASLCNLFQLLRLPWSVDLAGEQAPSPTSVCLLSGGAGFGSA